MKSDGINIRLMHKIKMELTNLRYVKVKHRILKYVCRISIFLENKRVSFALEKNCAKNVWRKIVLNEGRELHTSKETKSL